MKGKYKYLDGQYYEANNEQWRISRLVFLAEELKPFNIPMKALNFYNIFPKANNTLQFVKNMKKVLDVDTSMPIILDEEGYIMDGRHRVCRALFDGAKSIKAVRFEKTPTCCRKVKK